MCMLSDMSEEIVVEDKLCLCYVDENGFPFHVKEQFETEDEAKAAGLVVIKVGSAWLGETVFPYYCACGQRFIDWETTRQHVGLP